MSPAELPPERPVSELVVNEREGERLVLALREYKGARFVDLRWFYLDASGEWKPGPKGAAIPLRALGKVGAWLFDAQRALGGG